MAVALVVGMGALGFWLYAQAGAKTPLVMAVRDIPAGHVIGPSDLTTVEVAGGVTAIAGDHLSSVIGDAATVEILPNTLLQRAMVTPAVPLPVSQAMVGVAVSPGQIPSSGIAPGDTVEVLQLPDKSATGPAQPATVLTEATVFDVRDNPSTSGGTLLTLIVPRSAAAGIATASNAGLVALVQVGG